MRTCPHTGRLYPPRRPENIHEITKLSLPKMFLVILKGRLHNSLVINHFPVTWLQLLLGAFLNTCIQFCAHAKMPRNKKFKSDLRIIWSDGMSRNAEAFIEKLRLNCIWFRTTAPHTASKNPDRKYPGLKINELIYFRLNCSVEGFPVLNVFWLKVDYYILHLLPPPPL